MRRRWSGALGLAALALACGPARADTASMLENMPTLTLSAEAGPALPIPTAGLVELARNDAYVSIFLAPNANSVVGEPSDLISLVVFRSAPDASGARHSVKAVYRLKMDCAAQTVIVVRADIYGSGDRLIADDQRPDVQKIGRAGVFPVIAKEACKAISPR
ncbi:MAG: hypothetical protein JWP35_453 [Caulobacter sp.]|nr:hypothetical protein [Caulobacter sp.]